MAGNKYSSYISKRRRAYRTTYGYGISRTPRKILTRRGRRLIWVGATVPQTVGGRRAHPPKVDKLLKKTMPQKERRKAIRSAISATILPDIVKARGHHPPSLYPFVVEDQLCQITKTKELVKVLKGLGFDKELERTAERKVRAGRGKMRGRQYKVKKGLLIVVPKACPLSTSSRNIQGVEIVEARNLNADLLAPGGKPGRVTLWTRGAVELIKKEGLFA